MRVITGPTGVGKSSVAERFARKFQFRICNTDLFQFYQELPILSDRRGSEGNDMDYEFSGFRSLLEKPVTAGEFSRLSQTYVEKPNLIWVGTGLYLGAAMYGLDEKGVKGTPFQQPARQDYRMVVLDQERKKLYEKINQRVDRMVERGALAEAGTIYTLLQQKKIQEDHPALRAIGLQHLICYLRGQWSWELCLSRWKQDTRRLAKRQWTWLRKFCASSSRVQWISVDRGLDEVQSKVEDFLSLPDSKGIG